MEEETLDFKILKDVCEHHKIASIDGALGLGLDPKKGLEVKVGTKGNETGPSICWRC